MRLYILDKFECIADRCPEHCCGEWLIEVDSTVLTAWRELPDETNKALLEHVYQLDNDANKRSVLAKKEDGNCYCLNASGLCNLQSQYGESVIPETCRTYPRKNIRIGGDIIKTASLSCPEIARMIFVNTESKNLFVDEIDVDKKLGFSFSVKDHVYLSLYKFISEVLRHDRYSLSLKLSLISKVIGELVNKCERVNYNSHHITSILSELTNKPKNQLYNINNQLKNKKTCSDPSSFLQYWKTSINIYHERNINLTHLRFEESTLYKILRDGSSQAPGKTCDTIIQQFKLVKVSLLNEYDDVFYRYIHHIFIDRGFPLSPYGDNQLLALASCIISINLVCIALAAAIDNGYTIDLNMIIETVWRIERKLGHTNSIYDYIIENEVLMEPLEYYQYLNYLFI